MRYFKGIVVNIKQYYNNFYKEISKIDETANTFSKIIFFLPELNGKEKIIDVGCGHGGVCHHLIKKGFKVYGVEVNKDAIRSLKSKGFKVLRRDINLPLKINKLFDVILLLDVLEHVFDPYSLLKEVRGITKPGGVIIVSVPLYFDIIDRLKVLFTGSVISMDNLCYGEENYNKFRSYNYDHIRFFRPNEIIEMSLLLNLEIEKIEYFPTTYYGRSSFLKFFFRLIANKYTVKINPNLLAHSLKIRYKVN